MSMGADEAEHLISVMQAAKQAHDEEFARRMNTVIERYRFDPVFHRSVHHAAQAVHEELLLGVAPGMMDPDDMSELSTKIALKTRMIFDWHAEQLTRGLVD